MISVDEARERILRLALLALFQGGPVRIDENDKDAHRKADSFVARFDAAGDAHFFDELWREGDAADPHAERSRWVRTLAKPEVPKMEWPSTESTSRRPPKAPTGRPPPITLPNTHRSGVTA